MNAFRKVSSSVERALSNTYVLGIISLFVILYGSLARPQLPQVVMDLFDHWLFRLLVLTLIAFLGSRNIQVSFLVAILFTITMNVVSEQKIVSDVMSRFSSTQ